MNKGEFGDFPNLEIESCTADSRVDLLWRHGACNFVTTETRLRYPVSFKASPISASLPYALVVDGLFRDHQP